jgi:hypothetical protein
VSQQAAEQRPPVEQSPVERLHRKQSPVEQSPDGRPPVAPQRLRRALLIAGSGVTVVLIALVAFILLRGGSATATPESAASAMFEAFTSNDEKAYLQVACAADVQADQDAQASGDADAEPAAGLTSYSIGKTTNADATHATVSAAITANGRSTPFDVPVVKENGEWRVCLTQALSTVTSSSGPQAPLGQAGAISTSGPRSSLGADTTGSPGPAASSSAGTALTCGGQGDALTVASYYVVDIEASLLDLAKTCVYPGSVPDSVTAQLDGLELMPVNVSSGPDFSYTAESKRVTVRTAQKDGKWWVVKVGIR